MLPQSGKNEAYNKAMCALFVPMGLCQWPGLLSSHHEYCGCELSDYFLFLTFLIYPAVSSKFFSVFPCEDFEDGSSFLKAGTQAVQVAVCVGVGVGVWVCGWVGGCLWVCLCGCGYAFAMDVALCCWKCAAV